MIVGQDPNCRKVPFHPETTSDDHIPEWGTWRRVAFGNGCTHTRPVAAFVISLELYASQCPSGENAELRTIADGACAKTVAFLSFRDKVHTAPSLPRVAVNDRYWPSGDQESGIWASPCSGLVNRSAAPIPSAR